MNAAQLARSTPLARLRAFYATVMRLRVELYESLGEVTVTRVQGDLRARIDELTRASAEGPEEAGYHLLDELRFIMVALADEVFLHSDVEWPGREEWLTRTLEEEVYGTRRAGADFFRRVDDLLETRDTSREELAVAYLIALQLGFKGRYRAESPGTLVTYRERLGWLTGLGRGETFDPRKPLVPDVGAYTQIKPPRQALPDYRRYIRWLAAVVVVYLIAAHAAWFGRTWEVRQATTEFEKTVGTTAGEG